MSTTDTETIPTATVTYPGPHPAVNVPGVPDAVRRDEPIEVPAELAQRLVNQGWESDTLSAEERAPADEPQRTDEGTETADAPPAGAPPAPPAAPETADASPAGETADDPAALRRRPGR